MKIAFKKFTTSDYQDITELMEALYEDDPQGDPIDLENIEKTFKHFSLHPESGNIFVFEQAGVTIGYAVIVHYWSNEFGGNILVLDELYVKTDYRSLGVGTEFIGYLKEQRFYNTVAIELEVAPYNSRANQLYKELGFELNLNKRLMYRN